jgi:hypothetical protein
MLSVIVLNVILLSVTLLSVILLSVILSFIICSNIMPNVIMLSVIIPSVAVQCVIMLNVIILNEVVQSVIMHSASLYWTSGLIFTTFHFLQHFQNDSGLVPIWVCLLLVLCYISAGASLFCVSNGWNFIDSFFFCFAALGTIGIVEYNGNDDALETAGAVFVLVEDSLNIRASSLIS